MKSNERKLERNKRLFKNSNKRGLPFYICCRWGVVTAYNQTIGELEQIFRDLSLKLEETDKQAVRNKRQDMEVMNQSELNQTLSDKSRADKKRVLFSQIGYLRINFFSEYYERALGAESEEDYDKAIGLMDEYIKEVATPFISKKKQSKLLNKIKKLVSVRIDPDPVETINKWNNICEMWFKTNESKSWSALDRSEKYKQAKQIFTTLYWISFSYRNFPPVAQDPAH